MENKKPDAGDVAPRPDQKAEDKPPVADGRQDAPNYDQTTDDGRAIPGGDLSSANDE